MIRALPILLGSSLYPDFQGSLPRDIRHVRYTLVLFYKMSADRVPLGSRVGPDPLHSNVRVYDLSKPVEMGEIRLFSSLRSPFLFKIPFHLPKESVDPLDFIFSRLPPFCSPGNPAASLCSVHPRADGVQDRGRCCLDEQQSFAGRVSVVFSFLAAFDCFQFVGMSILSA